MTEPHTDAVLDSLTYDSREDEKEEEEGSYSHFSVDLVLLGLRLAASKAHNEGQHPEGREGPTGGHHSHGLSKSWPDGLLASQGASSAGSPGAGLPA